MTYQYQDLLDDTLDELYQFRDSGDEIVDYYSDNLETLVKDAIAKTEKYFQDQFNRGADLIDYFNNAGNQYSLDLIKDWDTNAMLVNGSYETCLDWLYGMLEDNLPYLLACGMLGHGRGLWELFDSFPCLNTLV